MKTIASYKLSALLWIVLIQICIQTSAFSQSVLNYQGRVVSGGSVFSGTGQFKFGLVSKDGSKTFWKNDGTVSDAPPNAAIALPVTKGLFAVQLGDSEIANMALIPPAALGNAGTKLRVWFNDGVKGWQQFSPDQPINLQHSTIASTENQTSIGTNGKIGAVLTSPDLVVPGATLFSLGKGDWMEFMMDFGVLSQVNHPLITSDGRYFYIMGGYDRSSKDMSVPVSKVYRYDPRSAETSVTCEIPGLYYKKNTADIGYNNAFTSAVQSGFKWNVIGSRIYVAGGGDGTYQRGVFGFYDVLLNSWTDLDDLVGNAAGALNIGGISKLSDGLVYLVTGKQTSDGYGHSLFLNAFLKHSTGTGWTPGGIKISDSSISGNEYTQLFGGGFFVGDKLFWFDAESKSDWIINSEDVFNFVKQKVRLQTIQPETGVPDFGGQGYGGYVLFPRATDIRIVEGIVYIVYGNSLYQIDLRGGRVAQRFTCKLGSADYKSFLVQCDGRLYVFTGPTADRTAWQGYSASLQSLRNVFIQN